MDEFKKPKCKRVGTDGNVFSLMGLASRALKQAGYPGKAREMMHKIPAQAKSYNDALVIIGEYVEIY